MFQSKLQKKFGIESNITIVNEDGGEEESKKEEVVEVKWPLVNDYEGEIRIYSWGWNEHGNLGLGSKEDSCYSP